MVDVGSPYVRYAQGGYIIEEFVGLYAPKYGLVLSVLCEAVVISWIYGLERFKQDIKEMLGKVPGTYWCLCWAVIAPCYLMVACSILPKGPYYRRQ